MTITVKSCCCFNLKTAGVLIGSIGIFINFIVIYVHGLVKAHRTDVQEVRLDSITMNVLKMMPCSEYIVYSIIQIN